VLHCLKIFATLTMQ